VLFAWLSALALVSSAAAPGADPAINRTFADPDFDTWVARFERPGREVYDQRAAIVAALRLRPGLDVADVGAGTGLFTLEFAPRVAPGRVYAVDVSGPFVARVEARAAAAGLDNVVGVVNDQSGAGLARASVDLVFVCDTYHHFEQPRRMLQSLHDALRAGGALVVVDFDRDPGSSSAWVLSHVRANRRQVTAEIESAGFRLVQEEGFLRENFFLRFERQ